MQQPECRAQLRLWTPNASQALTALRPCSAVCDERRLRRSHGVSCGAHRWSVWAHASRFFPGAARLRALRKA